MRRKRVVRGVFKYRRGSRDFFGIDVTVTTPDGRRHRHRERSIPTREQAEARAAQVVKELYERGHFPRQTPCTTTVGQLLDLYLDVAKHENDSWLSDKGRAEHVKRILGERRVTDLTERDVDEHRRCRLAETTKRKGPPSPATLDKEVELLKRVLNFGVRRKLIPANPLREVKLLRKPNVRRTVLTEEQVAAMREHLPRVLSVALLLKFDTGLRKRELLDLELGGARQRE